MKNIRFRAWDKKTLKMSPEFVLFGEFILLGAVHAWQYEMGNTEGDSLGRLDDLEIMQYTGLKDKNGVEIFEGDLIAEINNISELKKWGDPLAIEYGQFESEPDSWGVKTHTTGFFCRYKGGQQTGLHNSEDGYGFRANEIMVIGNIYQSPSTLSPTTEVVER